MKVVFLGYLKETAGHSEIQIEPQSPLTSVDALIETVAGDNSNLKDCLSHPSIRVIVNKSILAKDDLPNPIEEVAFMPPLSGG